MRGAISINPATEQVIQTYDWMDQGEVEKRLQACEAARRRWQAQTLPQRLAVFEKVGPLLLKNLTHYARLMSQEMGKPLTQAETELRKCARLCDYYVEHAEAFLKPESVTTTYAKSYRCFMPIGLILGIMPWNYPFWQVFRFAIPNLLLGNGIVLKHAPNVTGCALVMEQLFQEALGEPLLSTVIVDIDATPFLIQHALVQGVTFTGSQRAGRAVAEVAGRALKKVVLELGGSDPYLILEDADLELASEVCVKSRLQNAGQVCIAAKRLLVHQRVASEFSQLLLEKARVFQSGDPLDPQTTLGPMARSDLRQALHQQVLRVRESGATCLLGGEIPKERGFYYPATLFTDVTVDSCVFTEELFGPVLCVTIIASEEQGIALANQSTFGLGAGVFTTDIARGEQIAQQLEAGVCALNTAVTSDPALPFGGIKQSGFGRELAVEGMREFANIKSILIQKD